jgi:hypothetical protein
MRLGEPTEPRGNTTNPPALALIMCWQCENYDQYIAHCRELLKRATDPLSRQGLDILIEKAAAAKRDLHPDQPLN